MMRPAAPVQAQQRGRCSSKRIIISKQATNAALTWLTLLRQCTSQKAEQKEQFSGHSARVRGWFPCTCAVQWRGEGLDPMQAHNDNALTGMIDVSSIVGHKHLEVFSRLSKNRTRGLQAGSFYINAAKI